MTGKLFLMLVLAAASGASQAAKHAKATFVKSAPSHQALGFTLGQPPTLITCPTAHDGSFDSQSWSASLDSTCMESPTHAEVSADGREKTLPVHFSLSEEPSIAPGVQARGLALQILDGTVQGVVVRTSGLNSQKAIYAMLRKKYGVPSSLAKKDAGAAADGIRAEWVLSDLRVSFEGVGATPDEGSLSITTAGAFQHAMNSPASAQSLPQ